MNILTDDNFPYTWTQHQITSCNPIELSHNMNTNEPKKYKSLAYNHHISEQIAKSKNCDTFYNIAHQTKNTLS